MDKLFQMCKATAVSGNESAFAKDLKSLFDEFCDSTVIDNMGNLISVINSGFDKKIMIEAHMDEIGLMVKSIDSDGFIKFVPVGGVDVAILPSMEVIIHGKEDIFGVIGAKPPHLQSKDEASKGYKTEQLYIDAGYSHDEIIRTVSVGDYISFVSSPKELKNGIFTAKSIDNRMGIYVVYECLKRLKKEKLNAEIVGLCAVQEEVGCRGAKVGGYTVTPDCAFVIDVTHGVSPYIDDTLGFSLESGIAIGVGPNLNNKFTNKLIKICKDNNIKHTLEVCGGNSGTDAWVLQVSRSGIPCVLLSVPLRYMHTSVETVSKNDINAIIDAICIMVKEGVFDA